MLDVAGQASVNRRPHAPSMAGSFLEFDLTAEVDRLHRETTWKTGRNARTLVGDTVFYIQKGGVKLSAVSKAGREAVVAMLRPGDFVGEGCLAGQSVRMATATAMTPTPGW